MSLKADPGGRFDSDLHRRVAGHLSTPEDNFGYTSVALFHRMEDDTASSFTAVDEVTEVLDELMQVGFVDEPQGGVFRLTDAGLQTLSGPIADEPDPVDDESETTPARLDQPTPLTASVRSEARGA